MAINPSDRCTYRQLDNSIHELTIHESSRAAVDDMVAHIDTILKMPLSPTQPLRYLVDCIQADELPIIHLRNRIKTLNTDREPNGRPLGRVAILYDGSLGSIALAILKFATRNRLHFFGPAERAAAIDWLLGDDS